MKGEDFGSRGISEKRTSPTEATDFVGGMTCGMNGTTEEPTGQTVQTHALKITANPRCMYLLRNPAKHNWEKLTHSKKSSSK